MDLEPRESTIQLREIGLSDAAEILRIYEPYILNSSVTFDTVVPDLANIRTKIEKISARYPWIVCEQAGSLFAYAYANHYRERLAYRWSVEVSIYVDAQAQRQGLGKMLYDELFARLREQGFHMAYAGITLPNDPSVALHEKCGFKHVGVFPNAGYKFNRWQNVGWWALELSSALVPPHEPRPPKGK